MVLADIGAELEVVLDRQRGEGAAAVGHMGHAHADDGIGGLAHQLHVTGAGVERHAARGAHDLAQRAQGGGLAGTVAAQNGHDAPFGHLQRNALEHQDDVVVNDLNAIHVQNNVFGFTHSEVSIETK